tara:strand:- start:2945 stop:3412 length:468 start_codon:yes stop_codon:yes gene_type:complete
MKKKDPNYVVKLERAISEKYGPETIVNPKSGWDEDKEEEYKKQIKKWQEKQDILEHKNEKIEQDGFFISKKLLNKEPTVRTCPSCAEYSFDIKDDVYMAKFNCCYKCYIGPYLINHATQKFKESQSWKGKLKKLKRKLHNLLQALTKKLSHFFRK